MHLYKISDAIISDVCVKLIWCQLNRMVKVRDIALITKVTCGYLCVWETLVT